MLPLHEFLPAKGANATGTLLMFKRHEMQLKKNTNVLLFADQKKTKLLCQFDEESLRNRDSLKPKLIESNTVWMTYDEGNPELNEYDVVHRPKVACAMVQLPKYYSVVCWLTEVLTTQLVRFASERAPKYVLATYQKLANAMTTVFVDSKAPELIKSVILKLLSRLIKKLRAVYLTLDVENENYSADDHFAK
jgi:hypothetical protein